MATVILNIESKDNSTAVLQRVTQALQMMDRELATNAVTSRQVLQAVQQQNTATTQFASAQDRLAVATRNYQVASERALSTEQERQRIASSMGSATNEYASAANNAAQAADRQAVSGLRLADAYRQVATAQDRVQSSTNKLSAMSNAPLASSGGTSGESSMLGAGGNLLKNFLMYGVAYQALFQGVSKFGTSLGNNKNLSILAGQTVASTSMNPSDIGSLTSYAQGAAGSGTQPYSAQSTLSGLYGFLSQGFSKQQALSMNQYALGLSQIAGSSDTSQAATALLSLGNGFGWGSNTGASSKKYSNLLQAGANIGAFSLGQISQSLPNAGLAALGREGFDPRFVMSAMASGSFSGTSPEETAQNLNSLGQSLAKPNQIQRRFAKSMGIDIMPGAMDRAGGAMDWFSTLQQHMSAMSPSTQQYMLSGLFGNQSAGRLVSEMFAGSGPRSLSSVYGYMGQAQQGKGFYSTALGIENQTPGQQLANSEAKLSQQFDNMTKSLLPLESAVMKKLGTLAESIGAFADSFSMPGGFGKYVSGATRVLDNYLNPFGGTFLNMDASKAKIYQEMHPAQVAAQATVDAQQHMQGSDSSVWSIIEARQRAKHPGSVANSVSTNLAAMGIGPSFSGPGPSTLSGGMLTGLVHSATASNEAAQQYAKNAAVLMTTTGRGSTTADMTRFAAMVQDAILQHQPASVVASAMGLYKQAVNQNPTLGGAVKTEDILKEQKIVNAYLGSIKNAATLMPFHTPNPGMGGLEAGFQNTVARFGGAATTQQQLILKLEQQLAVANRQIALLQEIVANTSTQKMNTAHTSPLQGTGTTRGIMR